MLSSSDVVLLPFFNLSSVEKFFEFFERFAVDVKIPWWVRPVALATARGISAPAMVSFVLNACPKLLVFSAGDELELLALLEFTDAFVFGNQE